jgi:hypothetical protein
MVEPQEYCQHVAERNGGKVGQNDESLQLFVVSLLEPKYNKDIESNGYDACNEDVHGLIFDSRSSLGPGASKLELLYWCLQSVYPVKKE